jgi:arylsulfatase
MIEKKTSRQIQIFQAMIFALCAMLMAIPGAAFANPAAKPNILVIWGDDIGQSNISAYTRGVVGYRTPNIDRIAAQGMLFTDYYGEQSCTAGRSSFITGQSVFRTGLSTNNGLLPGWFRNDRSSSVKTDQIDRSVP